MTTTPGRLWDDYGTIMGYEQGNEVEADTDSVNFGTIWYFPLEFRYILPFCTKTTILRYNEDIGKPIFEAIFDRDNWLKSGLEKALAGCG